jgi:hypothetical protein
LEINVFNPNAFALDIGMIFSYVYPGVDYWGVWHRADKALHRYYAMNLMGTKNNQLDIALPILLRRR